jgi:protocatechuate 3,4-dioxygenase beta subunit
MTHPLNRPAQPPNAPQHDEEDDDQPIGRVLNRREMLSLLGGAGAALFSVGMVGGLGRVLATATPGTAPTATSLPSCVVVPELTEGPYFVDGMLNRSDIRIDPRDGSIKAGEQLNLKFRIFDVSANTCAPIEGAQVDVWHCDAAGQYSGVQDRTFDTSGQVWLRGYQLTDANGDADFTTIYPGWYSGRAVHIHFKVRTTPEAAQGYTFTSQLFFDPETTAAVYARQPYRAKGIEPDVANEEDNIFQGSDGLLTLTVERDEDDVLTAVFTMGLDLSQPASTTTGTGGARPAGGRGGMGAPPAPRSTPTPRP